MNKIIYGLLAIISTAACRKTEMIADKYITLSYHQTFCSDPWTAGTTESSTLVEVARYLHAKGLYTASLRIDLTGTPEVCSACICKTGKIISVSTLDSDSLRAQYARIGFK
ncbi:MAG TPA: hypothetical protein PLQ65_02505 [Flavihumibacter sp.]|nr:hypothetical protein [Flavihumibacter sp.]